MNASDYTTFIKLQAAQQAYRAGAVPRAIQTTAQPVSSQSVLNAQLLASQASFLVTPTNTAITGLNYVKARGVPQLRSNNLAKSTVGWTSGSSGSVGSYSSSAVNTGFGLPAKNRVGTYHRIPHTALPNTLSTGAYAPNPSTNTNNNTI